MKVFVKTFEEDVVLFGWAPWIGFSPKCLLWFSPDALFSVWIQVFFFKRAFSTKLLTSFIIISFKGVTFLLCLHNFFFFFFAYLGMGCNECTHPSCQHSLNSFGIGQCVECDSGVLVLDPTSGPKWRMACNKCNVVVHFFEHAHRVQVRKVLKLKVLIC